MVPFLMLFRTWPQLFLETEATQAEWGVRPYVDLWKRGFPLHASLFRLAKLPPLLSS